MRKELSDGIIRDIDRGGGSGTVDHSYLVLVVIIINIAIPVPARRPCFLCFFFGFRANTAESHGRDGRDGLR